MEQKSCLKCGGLGPFAKNRSKPDGLQSWCKACLNEHAAEKYAGNPEKYLARTAAYRKNNPEKYKEYERISRDRDPSKGMWKRSKHRAKLGGIPFDIEPSDISIPEFCPLLGIRLIYGVGVQSRNSPTLDRKDPLRGYVKGNVWVISYKANAMKQDASPAELELFATNVLLARRRGVF